MPEIPDVELYVSCLAEKLVGHDLIRIAIRNPYVLKSVDPPPSSLCGKRVIAVSRIAKRIVLEFEDDLFIVIHLMIAGRLRWGDKPMLGKIAHANLEFENGVLALTEASTKKRAAIAIVAGREKLRAHDPGGLDPTTASREEILSAIMMENRTLKRALTQQHRIAGIGNAYSDEILHRAALSPLKLTHSLKPNEKDRLVDAIPKVLGEWSARLRTEFLGRFPGPGEVTAFRPDFAVHGRFSLPCPECGAKIQRIRYADNETNYCARCQNEDRVLADRALSRLLKSDWPKTLEELE